MCDGGFDGHNDVEDGEWRTARKAHECCACDLPIRKGDRYHVLRTLYDGSWSTSKHCARCWTMCDLLAAAPFTDGVVLTLDCGVSWEDASGEPPPAYVAALAFWLPGDPLPQPEEVMP